MKKANLTLVWSEKGSPTLADLIALTKQLTGKPPTPQEIAEMKKILSD